MLLKSPYCIVRYSDKAVVSLYEDKETGGIEWTKNRDDAQSFDRISGEYSADSFIKHYLPTMSPEEIGIIELRRNIAQAEAL